MPRRRSPLPSAATAVAGVVCALLLTACGAAGSPAAAHGRILAVGAESQYADVISQIGGRYVYATSVMNDPNVDPHAYEASPSVAETVARAQLVVQNGLGYDTFMSRIESAAPNPRRAVVDVQSLLRLPDSTANPHLW